MNIVTIDPRLKLAWCITAVSAGFALENLWAQLFLIGLIVALEWCFTKSLKHFGVLSLVLLVVASQLIVIQLLFCREGVLLWEWGIIKIYSEAIPNAITGFLRTSALAYAGVQFIGWTSGADAVLMLRSFGLPYRYAMLAGVTARFFPIMQKEYIAISQSQAVRGLAMDGLWNRIKALPPTFFPLLYRAMRKASDTALSMDLRGFGRTKERTFTKDLSIRSWEKALVVIMVLLIVLLILYKFIV